jgi:hypothetical protein
MTDFKDVIKKIKEGIEDLSTLEVVNFKGKITIGKNAKAMEFKFSKILEDVSATGKLQITACTYVELDGDVKVFYDTDITKSEIEAHNQMVDIAKNNRQAVVDLFKDAIISTLD